MHRTIPVLKNGQLYRSKREGDSIDVGTPARYDWLKQHDSFIFIDRRGTVIVYKRGTDPHEQDWKAFYSRMGKLFRVSLGPSDALTLSRLQAAARGLTGKHVQGIPIMLSPVRPAAGRLAVPVTAITVGSRSSLIQTKRYRPYG